MPDYESLLNRWLSAGVLDAEAAARIRIWESAQQSSSTREIAAPGPAARESGLAWQGRLALILGGILLASGIVLFVSSHWDQLGPAMRYTLVMAMVTIFHLGGAFTRNQYPATSSTLHAVGTVSTGAAIALVGQIFNIQEHWPAAILLWAIAALCGWKLLRDQAQQTLSLLLVPSWLICEWGYAVDNHIGAEIYVGRFLFVWAILYLTLFIDTRRRIVRGILFGVSTLAAVASVSLLLTSWRSWSGMQPLPLLHTRFWGWVVIAVVPLLFSLFSFRKATAPVLAAIAFVIALPWCERVWIEHYPYGNTYGFYTRNEPNLLAHALVAGFCVFLIWWGVRQASRGLVNFGVIAFGMSVAWFYFSNIFDKFGRSLGLIGLGILFLAGGWALEKTRRGLLARMAQMPAPLEEAR
ncbi:DUF2157 domain-containing protein [Occallatibacter savannae]|uniref:DUF2157 domain-containing protein n=1 Tax=Occallatibacter savannae TaxID=1002691 RepID=UPI0013A5856F|nr:DUF2157 domain-containing protein [Occallatibacter savannae]